MAPCWTTPFTRSRVQKLSEAVRARAGDGLGGEGVALCGGGARLRGRLLRGGGDSPWGGLQGGERLAHFHSFGPGEDLDAKQALL